MGGAKTSTRQQVSAIVPDDSSPAIKTIRQIMERAIKAGASDVHIEPRSGYGVVRQRIDGLLYATTKVPGTSFGTLVMQFKKLGGLNAAQKLAPQAGHYNISIGQRSYDIHIATLPVLDGEHLTLHIADLAQAPVSLQALGYWGPALDIINHALTQPHGLLIVNSTDQNSALLTLGSMLSVLSSPDIHLATVEQNILYHLPHVSQTVVKKEIGMTFSRRLKQILAREPNIVMVSDVLDKNTAKAITKAAAGRQLVLAGMHAQDTVRALAGFIQLSSEPTVVAGALQVIVSQKLVAKLCEACRESYEPSRQLTADLARIFGTDNAARMLRLHKLEAEALAERLGVNTDQPASAQCSTTERRIVRLWRPHNGGCKTCHHSGYSGRLTINEIMPPSPALQTAIQTSANINQLRKTARLSGIIPLSQDALIKALRGLLPIETVLAHAATSKKA